MVDWLVVWGVAQAAGFAFKPILADLAKETAKDYAKDFFKDCLKKVIRLPEPDAQKEAYGKALKELLQLVQQELEDADYQDAQIKQYTQPLRKFIEQEEVAAILGQAFEESCRGLDIQTLAKTWRGLELPYLPEEFNWERLSKRYLRKVKAIVHESEKLRPIFEAQSQATVAEGMQELVGIAPVFDLGRYAEGLREQYGNLKLESLDTTGVYYSELKLWKLFIPQNVRECQEFLPQVYEIPKEHERRLRQSGQVDEAELAEAELEQYRRVYVEQPIRSVLEVVGDPIAAERSLNSPILGNLERVLPKVGGLGGQQVDYAVILGDPGSGKSTLLQYMALVWAERPLSELPLYPIPLLIELRSYARDQQAGQCQDILAFIHCGNITCRLNQQQLHDKLRAGQAIALFDGIDEVFDPALRDRVVTDIHRFTNEYPAVQVIVTSRWLGYKAQRLRDAGFRHFMLQDLEDQQIEAFIQRWHDLTFLEGADKQRKRDRLQKAIRDSKAIRELAGNPLLLTMMAILNRNQELPRDRPELYNQASRVLLHQWDVERALVEDYRLDPKTIDYRDKQAMLRKVAYHMQSSEKGLAGNAISRAELEAILTDYLKNIVGDQAKIAARLMINQLHTRNFILCDLGADTYAFVHRTFLEYFCASEIVHRFEKQHILTFEQLQDEVFGQHWQDETWHEVLRLICGMIDAEFAGKAIEFLLEQEFDRSAFLTQNTYGEDYLEPEGLTDLLLAANCLREVVNSKEISHIREHLLQLLKQEFENSKYTLGINAMNEIASCIAQGFPDTLLWLKKQATQRHYRIPWAVIWAISINFNNDSDTFPWLKDLINKDECVYVREAVSWVLACSYSEDLSTFPLLKMRIQQDEEAFVRRAAVAAVSTYLPNHFETFNLLCFVAVNDPFIRQNDWELNPRYAAIEGLLKNYPDRPQTLELLHDRAQNDPDEQVREFARQKSAELEEQK